MDVKTLEAKKSKLDGVIIVNTMIYEDARGFFGEAFNQKKYENMGINKIFIQDNLSFSYRNVLRGLHFQNPKAQAKLVSVIKGEAYDVFVDLRKESPTFNCWEGYLISEYNRRQIFIPEGFAHGFVSLSNEVIFYYKCSEYYSPENECCIRWDDPDLAIDWMINCPVISEKDQNGFYLKDLPKDKFF